MDEGTDRGGVRAPSWWRRLARSGSFALAVAAVVLGVGFLLRPVLGERDVITGDTRIFEGARDRLLAETLASGPRLPHWTPEICGGASAVAAPELGLFYPVTILLAWLDADRAVARSVLVHLVLAALGARALARRLGAGERAAALGALAYAFGGALVSCNTSPTHVASNAWTPWIVWGVLGASEGRASGLLAATLAQLAMLVCGDPQLLPAAGAVSLAVAGARAPRQLPRALGALVASGAGAAILGAVQLAPALAILGDQARNKGFTYEVATGWSLVPSELAGLFVPFLFGAASQRSSGCVWFEAISPEHSRAWAEAYYIGPIVLALVALGLTRVRTSALARGGALVAALFFPLALGRHLAIGGWEIYRWLFEHPPAGPFLALFRFPAKLAVPASLGLALLAAAGAAGLGSARERRRLTWILALEALVAVVGAGTTWAFASRLGASIDALGEPKVQGSLAVLALAPRLVHVAAFALGAALLAARARSGRRLGTALVTLVVLDLGLALGPAFFFVPRESFARTPKVGEALTEITRRDGCPARVLAAPSALHRQPEDTEGGDLATLEGLAPNSGLGRRVFSQDGFLANPSLRWVLLERRTFPLPFARRAILRGARYVYVEGESDGERELGTEATGVAIVGGRKLLRLEAAPAWAQLVGRVRLAGTRKAAGDRLVDPAFDPRHEVVLETDDALACVPELGERGRAWLDSTFEDDRFEVALEAPAPGWLVVRESFARGWTARVDGVERPIVAADIDFRAVHVDAGARRVAFEFEPPGLAAGAWVSALGASGLALALAAWVTRRRRAAGSS